MSIICQNCIAWLVLMQLHFAFHSRRIWAFEKLPTSCVITVHVHWLGKESWMKQWKNYRERKVKTWWGEREALCDWSSYLLSIDTVRKRFSKLTNWPAAGTVNFCTVPYRTGVSVDTFLCSSFPDLCGMYHLLDLLQPWLVRSAFFEVGSSQECNLFS